MRPYTLLPLLLLLSGCTTPLLVGTMAAGGAAVAYDRRPAEVVIDDQGIEIHALNAINRSGQFDTHSHINVTSMNGVVLLSGEVPDSARKARAETLVRGLQKVREVRNELLVGPAATFESRGQDTWITTRAKANLLADEELGAGRAKVVTERGTLYLMGLLYHREADAATRIVQQVDGVKRIVRMVEYLD